ncbi:MAG: GTP cyclohydrolase I FolE [Blastocatellia bacterium]|jgi:GTP cyclohydrolase I|nr:GTP cyclohydrolase I FolE [Blastocatellia bacterium]MBK6428429.1 GTP cyclohydrolase I FolE [Blastocatellia bacterium]
MSERRVDLEKIERGVRLILEGIGEDADRPGIADTPRRVAKMYAEICEGLHLDPAEFLKFVPDETHDEMIVVKNIPLYSICEHHLVPFHGVAHIAYIPDDGRILGLSKLARIVDRISRRPQIQERLTTQVAELLDSGLQPKGVMVVIEAEHLCMSMRGIKKPGTTTVTSAVRGNFRRDPRTRAEAMAIIEKK